MTARRPVVSHRAYETAMAVSLVVFVGAVLGLAASRLFWWDWGWSFALLVLAGGAWVGAMTARDFAGELRNAVDTPARVPVGSDDDWEKGEA